MIAKEIGYIVNPKIFQELDNLRMSILSFIKYLKGLHK
jgi:hypothetical protein